MRVHLGLPSSALHLPNLGLELEDWSQEHLPPAHKTHVNAAVPVHAHVHPSTPSIHSRAPINTHAYIHANEAKGGCQGRLQLTETDMTEALTETDMTEADTDRDIHGRGGHWEGQT